MIVAFLSGAGTGMNTIWLFTLLTGLKAGQRFGKPSCKPEQLKINAMWPDQIELALMATELNIAETH